jgi:uncharacterized protein (TIGR03437 family)
MDAVQKLLSHRNFLFFLVLALTLCAPAWADTQFSLSSNTVTCASTTVCSPANISVGSTGAAIAYSVSAPNYSQDTNSNNAWLTVNPTGAGQTPGNLNFSIFLTTGLGQGVHTATVTVHATDGSGATDQTITVTFNAGVGGGGSGTLSSTVNPFQLIAAPNATNTVSATINTTSSSSITVSVSTQTTSCTGVNWLSASFQGNTTISQSGGGAVLNVQGNANGLNSGVCQGTVTVMPSVGTNLVIPVTFTVGSGSSGNLSAFPNPVQLSYSTGGTLPSGNISMTTTTGVSFVNATVNGCSQNWLFVNGSTSVGNVPIANGLAVSANSNAASLSTGNYTCSFLISDANNSSTNYTVSVNLQVNGGSSTGLTVSPNPITFNAPFNGSQQSTTVTISSQQGGNLSISQSSSNNFLSFQNSTGFVNAGQNVNIAVFANPAGLSVGTYTGSLNITVGAQSVSVPVTLTVGGSSGGGNTGAAPSTVNLVYQSTASPSFASHPNIAITGPDGQWTTSINYTSGSGGWLLLSPATGNLPNDRQLTLAANISGLSQGNYSATLTITTTGGSTTVTVNLAVVAGTIVYANPGSALFFYNTGNSAPSPQNIFVANSDNSSVTFTATPVDNWVSVQQTSGSTVFSVSVDPTKLPNGGGAGLYTSSVTISESGATNSPYSFPVVISVNGGGGGGGGGGSTLSFSPSSISFSASNSTTQSQTLFITAASATTFTVTASQNWLGVTPNFGTANTSVTVTANPSGLANGQYTGNLTFSYNGSSQTVGVTFTVSGGGGGGGGNVQVTCVSSCGTTQPNMAFTGQVGAGVLPIGSLNVTNASGSAQLGFTVSTNTSSGGSWLTTSAATAVLQTPFNGLGVSVNVGTGANALAAGTYNGTITVTPQGGGTAVTLQVTLTVTAPPAVSATPTSLTFSYRAGDPNPASQTVTVNPATSTLNYAVTVSPANSWLSVTPTSGTTPGSLTVSINPSGLTAGSYTGTITVAGTNGATGSTTVSVSLTVTAPLPTVSRVVNAASYLAGSIAPGEIITLFASDANHPIGPSTPVGLTLDSTGKVATTLGGVQVLINGFACPMIYASATQLSAVVPYEVAPLVTASVIVRYLGQSSNGITVNIVTTSPGIFTLNSTGTGPAAALNQNNTVNSPNNPANRGDVVVLYLTGEGQTSPAGVTGKVTVANSTPPYTPGPLLPIGITIGGQPANYSFAGEAPGIVSGVLQINVTVPTNISAGDVPLFVSIGGNSTQTGVTISVR